jgi:hypothetical protein
MKYNYKVTWEERRSIVVQANTAREAEELIYDGSWNPEDELGEDMVEPPQAVRV